MPNSVLLIAETLNVCLLLGAAGDADHLRMDDIVSWLLKFHQAYPVVGILLLIMGLDVAVGLCAAVITKSVSSTVSHRGMVRKVIMLLLVGVGAVLDPYAGGIPLSKMVAMCFLVTESISIIENAARAGVPIPKPLYEVLQKLTSNEKAAIFPNGQPQTVNIRRAGLVDIHSDGSNPSKPGDSSITIRDAVTEANAPEVK